MFNDGQVCNEDSIDRYSTVIDRSRDQSKLRRRVSFFFFFVQPRSVPNDLLE